VVILSQDLTIRRYTATAEKLFNFIPSDVGRRLSDITRNIHVPELEDIIHDVNENLAVVEREVQDREGRWYSLRVRPYRTQQNRIDGAVLMLLDIEEIKRAMVQMMGIVRHPLLLLHSDLTVSRANNAFYEVFQVSPKETENRNLYDLGNRQWNIPKLRQLLEEILPSRAEVHDFLVEHEFPQIGVRKIMINARRFYGDDRGVERIAVAFEDVTDRA
jgi:two-component system CheB/CheR fusion protein